MSDQSKNVIQNDGVRPYQNTCNMRPKFFSQISDCQATTSRAWPLPGAFLIPPALLVVADLLKVLYFKWVSKILSDVKSVDLPDTVNLA
jgi:hypothetical protein